MDDINVIKVDVKYSYNGSSVVVNPVKSVGMTATSVLTGPKGEKGDKGDQGDKGDTGTTDYNDLLNKPDLSVYATKIGVDASLAGKAEKVHVHTISDVTGLQSELTGKANSVHTHMVQDVTGLQAELDSKAEQVHNHAIADVSGLQSALDSKSATTHNHDGRYYTESETDAKLAPKADVPYVDAQIKTRVNKNLVELNAKSEGAVGDGIADDTVILQSLFDSGKEFYIPAGTYKVTGNGIKPTVAWKGRGAGKSNTKIINANGSVLDLSGPNGLLDGCSLTDIALESTGGDTVVNSRIARSNFERMFITQNSADKSIWNTNDAALLLECSFNDITTYAFGVPRSVPAWNIYSSSTDAITQNVWYRNIWWNAKYGQVGDDTQFYFRLAATGASNKLRNNTFREITFENTRGGGLVLESATGTLVDRSAEWDIPANKRTKPFISLIKNTANSSGCQDTRITYTGRVGDSPNTGVQDISLDANSVRTVLDNIYVQGSGVVLRVDLGSTNTSLLNMPSTYTLTGSFTYSELKPGYMKLVSSGSSILTADSTGINVNSKKISNVADPTLAQDAASKNYVDAQLTPKADISYVDTKASTANLTAHTSNTSNPHSVTKAQVGLGNVDNTSDVDKPVSTAQAAADALKVNKAGDTMSGRLNSSAAVLGFGQARGGKVLTFGTSSDGHYQVYNDTNANFVASFYSDGSGIEFGAGLRSIKYGNGFPNGVVSAPVGSIYIDTAVTNGASSWIKKSGTGNTGWQVLEGDTGWRNISADVTNGWTGGLRIRRTSNMVYISAGRYSFTGAAATSDAFYTLPLGFRASGSGNFGFIGVAGVGSAIPTIALVSINRITHQLGCSAMDQVSGDWSFLTDNAWLTTLPGTV